jgi:serine/threonine protein kinase
MLTCFRVRLYVFPVFDIVCAANRFDEARARLYFIQLAQGVAYMHAHLICHLDLSLENLLMTDDDVLKICDFGLARMMELDERRHLVAYKGVAKNKPGKMGYMSENTQTTQKSNATRVYCADHHIFVLVCAVRQGA